MTRSLNARLMLVAGVVMVLFFGITAIVLDSIYRDDALTALQDRLESEAYTLIAASELGDDGVLRLSYLMPDTRFLAPTSRIFAQITANDSGQAWHSASMNKLDIPFTQDLKRGEQRFEMLTTSDGRQVYAYGIGIAWQGTIKKGEVFTISVAESLRDLADKTARFRRSLLIWLGAAAIVLLAIQSLILRWGMRPLTRVANELRSIERGESQALEGDYPTELRALTQNLNTLIRNRHELIERYRNSLGDLAHSLKTPLAVLRGVGDEPAFTDTTRATLQEQVDHMNQIVAYQLQRAAASGATALSTPIPVRPAAEKILATLKKVYADKPVHCEINADPLLVFRGDPGDLTEILGNVLDNAFKWSRTQVMLRCELISTGDAEPRILIGVEDDGPGISGEHAAKLMQRGVRIDPTVAGHGIGLAVVRDLVQLYQGAIQITRSRWGGAQVCITLPGM